MAVRAREAQIDTQALHVGISCFTSAGGSGVIATEVGLALAAHGHQVYFITPEPPMRLVEARTRAGWPENVHHLPVEVHDYPVFGQVPSGLALSAAMMRACARYPIEILHAHYAIPHAASAYLAVQGSYGRRVRLVTTLHGTDVSLLSDEAAYGPVIRQSVCASDAVTAPSAALRRQAWRNLGLDAHTRPIEVIPNFVDTQRFRPRRPGEAREALRAVVGPQWAAELDDHPVVAHVSNFRSVKRVPDVIRVFAQMRAQRSARLLLVGDGPQAPKVRALIAQLDLTQSVCWVAQTDRLEALLRACDLFLLPSESESFGLAALEALSCGVPVVATAVGGLPEVIPPEVGTLCPVGDVAALAEAGLALLAPQRHAEASEAARAHVLAHFQHGPLTARYEALYRRVLGRAGRSGATEVTEK